MTETVFVETRSGQPGATGTVPDLDLRLLRYFVAVAEHANFGRAAESLRLAQPSLSRQIRRLEQQLDARLLDRTPTGSTLTEAGTVFLPEARALLAAAGRATAAVRAVTTTRTFTIGHAGGLAVADLAREVRRRLPGWTVRTRLVEDAGVSAALRDGKVDGVVARLPFDTEGLRVQVLAEEPRVLVVPRAHRLAGSPSVTPDRFADDARVACTSADGAWTSFWRVEPHSGGPVPLAPVTVSSFEDKLELVAAGEAVAVLAAGDLRLAGNEAVVGIPIDGIEPARVVVAMRTSDGPSSFFFESVAASLASEAATDRSAT